MLIQYANKKDADQPEHSRSLISTFIVRCLDSIPGKNVLHTWAFSSILTKPGINMLYIVVMQWFGEQKTKNKRTLTEHGPYLLHDCVDTMSANSQCAELVLLI